jgi:hypothetical protein
MKILCFAFFLVGFTSLYAQSIQPNVIASAGGSYSNDHLQLDWTIGEAVIETVHNGDYILTQGFHQPDIFKVSTLDFNEHLSLRLQPNPVQEALLVNGEFESVHTGQFQLCNAIGQQIWSSSFSGKTISLTIDMKSFAAGIYFFNMVTADHIKGIQLIKVN